MSPVPHSTINSFAPLELFQAFSLSTFTDQGDQGDLEYQQLFCWGFHDW